MSFTVYDGQRGEFENSVVDLKTNIMRRSPFDKESEPRRKTGGSGRLLSTSLERSFDQMIIIIQQIFTRFKAPWAALNFHIINFVVVSLCSEFELTRGDGGVGSLLVNDNGY